jgi:hypothetical protein
MMEALTKYWGFYFVAVPDSNGVGVTDFHDALDGVAMYNEWIPDLRTLDEMQRPTQSNVNSYIAKKVLRKVLAARVVVFKIFLELVKEMDKDLHEKNKRIWLLFQVSDQLNPLVPGLHPFNRIIRNCLVHASYEAVKTLIYRLGDIRRHYIPRSNFIIGLDEAQYAVGQYRHAFLSSVDHTVYRSMLCKAVKVFESTGQARGIGYRPITRGAR